MNQADFDIKEVALARRLEQVDASEATFTLVACTDWCRSAKTTHPANYDARPVDRTVDASV